MIAVNEEYRLFAEATSVMIQGSIRSMKNFNNIENELQKSGIEWKVKESVVICSCKDNPNEITILRKDTGNILNIATYTFKGVEYATMHKFKKQSV